MQKVRDMKAKLVPLYFVPGRDEEFDTQLAVLRELFADVAEFLEPVAVGEALPEADAIIFPQLIGEAYKQIEKIKQYTLPILAVTSEFGTVAMWDWEIATYFRSQGVDTFTPYDVRITKILCRALGAKRELQGAKFLVFQDDPGEGMQPAIFKRFYWWEDECTKRMLKKFGVQIVKKSFKKLGAEAKAIDETSAKAEWEKWNWPAVDVPSKSLNSAMKMYLAIKKEVEADERIIGAGINCLNESAYSDSTPCLAWNLLFEDKELIWACEADTMSLLTKYIVYKSTKAPVMMTNIYPFLLGMAALKHEKIETFPDIEDPAHHLLLAHCGYFGLLPRCFAEKWNVTRKALGIVDENAIALDAQYAPGDITMITMHPMMEKMLVVEGVLEGYAQYPGSDCRNGGIVRVQDGYKLINKLYSHHSIVAKGKLLNDMKYVAGIFNLQVETV